MGRKKKGLCEKCLKLKDTWFHHPLPRRWFGKNSDNPGDVYELCRVCHAYADDVTDAVDRQIVEKSLGPPNYVAHANLYMEAFQKLLSEGRV